ncbi:MAG: phospholipase D-like domain-containing protein [Candidatus Nanopelagicales bacterium]
MNGNTRHTKTMRGAVVAVAVIGLTLTGCSSNGSQPAPPAPTSTGITSGVLQFGLVQPNSGTQPVVDFFNSAKKTLDISMYEFDSTFSALVDPLKAAKQRGVTVRILISPTRLNPDNTPQVSPQNAADVQAFNAMGFQAELASQKEFAWYHQKSVVADSGQSDARALIADFNFASDYFDQTPSPYDANQEGTRGMAVIDNDKDDVATIARTFNEDWPPHKKWTGSDRPDLVWAPSGPAYNPKGNSIKVFTDMLNNATSTIDAYVQVFNYETTSLMLEPLLNATKRGVKVRFITNKGGLSKAGLLPQLQAAGIQLVMAPQAISDSSKYLYIHTKSVIVDQGKSNQVLFVGSENPFLNDSLNLERELGVLVHDASAITQALDVYNRDFGVSQPYANS